MRRKSKFPLVFFSIREIEVGQQNYRNSINLSSKEVHSLQHQDGSLGISQK